MTRVAELAARRCVEYYDAIAEVYDAQVEVDEAIRRSFQNFVKRRVAPGSLLLDFGCGTGSDSLQYTADGYRVVGCDVSSGMLAQFRRRCAAEIESGTALCMYADELPTHRWAQRPAAVVSNFAVLCLLPELPPLFRMCAEILPPGGLFLCNLLNPLYWRDLVSQEWWRAVPSGWRRGSLHLEGRQLDSHRHFLRALDRAARPHFARVEQICTVGAGARVKGRGAWLRPLVPAILASRYRFVVYRRCG